MDRPLPPYFDESRGEWVFSRYADVMAALREPLLWPPASSPRDASGRLLLRGPSQEALARIAEWEPRIAAIAQCALDRLSLIEPVDLLADYALPWCLEVAMLVVQGRPEDAARLADLGAQVFAATGAPDDSPQKPRAAAATAELVRLFADGPMPMGEPTFIAISQTTPRLLASIWLALLRHPDQAAQLAADPTLWPAAADELLRHAGIVRRIRRDTRAPVDVAGIHLAQGQRVMLMLAAANRDPAQFPDPDRLDFARPPAPHLALGWGRNSCIGAALLRVLIGVTTRALWERFPALRLCIEPEFRTGSGYRFPVALFTQFLQPANIPGTPRL